MDLSCSVFEINGDFGRNSQIFHSPHALNVHAEEVPLEFCNSGGETTDDAPTRWFEKVYSFRYNTTTWSMEGHREMTYQHRAKNDIDITWQYVF